MEKPGWLSPLQNAIYLLRQAQGRLAAYERAAHEPIAIVGLGCRFPGGVDSAETYWEMLRNGVDAIREVPPAARSRFWPIESPMH